MRVEHPALVPAAEGKMVGWMVREARERAGRADRGEEEEGVTGKRNKQHQKPGGWACGQGEGSIARWCLSGKCCWKKKPSQ